MKLISLSPFLSFVLIPFITVSPVWAQIPASPGSSAAADPTVAQNLQLRLVEREAAEVPPGSKALKGFTVEVTDSAGTPVQDAAVAARFPDNGPSGVFADGTRALVVYTDASGRARISGIRWGETPGVVTLRVTATKGISHAGMLIEQTLGATAIPQASSETRPPTTVTVVPVMAPVQPATAIPGTKPKLVPAQLPPAQPATPQTKPIPAVVVTTTAGQAAMAQNAQNTTPQNSPSRRTNSSPSTNSATPPAVSVSNTAPGEAPHKSHAKWLILALVAAGAGAGVAMAGKGKSNSSNPASSALVIGSPSISVGSGH